jgi:hypothetical protein
MINFGSAHPDDKEAIAAVAVAVLIVVFFSVSIWMHSILTTPC